MLHRWTKVWGETHAAIYVYLYNFIGEHAHRLWQPYKLAKVTQKRCLERDILTCLAITCPLARCYVLQLPHGDPAFSRPNTSALAILHKVIIRVPRPANGRAAWSRNPYLQANPSDDFTIPPLSQ